MILSMLGFLFLIFSVTNDNGVSIVGIVISVVMILTGLMAIDVHAENVKIRSAKRQYWLNRYDEMEAEKRKKRNCSRV